MDIINHFYKRFIYKTYEDKKGNVICPLNSPCGKIYFSLTHEMSDPLSLSVKSGDSQLLKEPLYLLKFLNDKNEKTFVDIGANIGIWSLAYAKAGFKVIGFEASKENFLQLINAADHNRFNCHFENLAVAESSGECQFLSRGPYGYIPEQSDKVSDFDIVKKVSLDDFFNDKEIHPEIALLKMDIEGGEINALKGMKNFLRINYFPPCFVESNGYCLSLKNQTPINLITEFKNLDYTPFIIKNGILLNCECIKFQYNCVEDYLFLHSSSKFLKNKKIINYPQTLPKDFFKFAFQSSDISSLIYYSYIILNTPQLHDPLLIRQFLKKKENVIPDPLFSKLADLVASI